MKALMSSRPLRGSRREYCNIISGAARSSTIFRLQVFPQKSVNQRPTIALLSLSFDMMIAPVFVVLSPIRDLRTVEFGSRADTPLIVLNCIAAVSTFCRAGARVRATRVYDALPSKSRDRAVRLESSDRRKRNAARQRDRA